MLLAPGQGGVARQAGEIQNWSNPTGQIQNWSNIKLVKSKTGHNPKLCAQVENRTAAARGLAVAWREVRRQVCVCVCVCVFVCVCVCVSPEQNT